MLQCCAHLGRSRRGAPQEQPPSRPAQGRRDASEPPGPCLWGQFRPFRPPNGPRCGFSLRGMAAEQFAPRMAASCFWLRDESAARGADTSCINGCTKMGTAGSNPRPIRSDPDRPPTCISDRNAVPMVAMGPFRSPLRPGWVTGSARLSGGCAAHARSSGARRVAELRALRRTGRLSPAHNFAKANLHADQRDVDAPSGPNVRFFLSAARA